MLCWYNKVFNRRRYTVINNPVDYIPNSFDRTVSKTNFTSSQEAQNTNRLYASAFVSAVENGPPIKPEHGFRPMNPYVEKLRGPSGQGAAPESKALQSVEGFAHVYHMSHEVPQAKLVRLLGAMDWPRHGVVWSAQKIDSFVPPYLYDRRLDFYTGTVAIAQARTRRDFDLNSPWKPLPITGELVQREKHVMYCMIVCRLYLLERLIVELRDNVKDNTTFASLVEVAKKRKKRGEPRRASTSVPMKQHEQTIHSAIDEAMKWQETMLGAAMFMDATGVYKDEKIRYEFELSTENKHSSIYDVGLHWVMHEGELFDISALIPHFPYWAPVEKRKQRNRRVRGRSTDTGSIGDMRGTPFESDPYVCAIMNIMTHGLPEPNKIRNADLNIVRLIRRFMGRSSSDEDEARDFRVKTLAYVDFMSSEYMQHADAATKKRKKGRVAPGGNTPDERREEIDKLAACLKDLCEKMLQFNDKRLGGGDEHLSKCCRTNRIKLRDAICAGSSEDVLAAARAFLGMPEIDFSKYPVGDVGAAAAGSSDEDDEFADIFATDSLAAGMIYDKELEATASSGRAKKTWAPKWSSVEQKNVMSHDYTLGTKNGGHNAHRLLDFFMRQVACTLLGRYDGVRTHPSFYTVAEIYRLIQFDYISIEQFCQWLETPLPQDVEKSKGKKSSQPAAAAAAEASAGAGGKKRRTYKKKADKNAPSSDGSDIRRYFIVYVIREYHIHCTRQMPALWQTFCELYKWSEIVSNIAETCDAIRFLVDVYMRDYYIHKRQCMHPHAQHSAGEEECNHCSAWREVEATYDPRLVRLYKRWPVLFAIDKAAQWKPLCKENGVKFRITHVKHRHDEFLGLCWRPAMRKFSQNIVDNIMHIETIMVDPEEVAEKFTPKKSGRHLISSSQLDRLSARASENYRRVQSSYMTSLYPQIKRVVELVVSRFPPGADVGIEWLMLLGVSMESVLLLRNAQQTVESEKKRSEAYYALMEILAFHEKDYFIMRTFYEHLVYHDGVRLCALDGRILRMQVNAIAAKLGREVVPTDSPLMPFFTEFYVCCLHGKLNAAMVGTELGVEGEKNTKSFGHNGISIDSSVGGGGSAFCTTSGKRVDRSEGSDVYWECMNTPNKKVDLLGSVFQVYDSKYVMCPHCGNPMEYRWERFCCGQLLMWCGQCLVGMKRNALQRGLVWKDKSVTPCARSELIGGLPIASDECPYCNNRRASRETMTYHLMWDDTDPSGRGRLAYFPVCNVHTRVYHGDDWRSMSLTTMTYRIQNGIYSVIVRFKRIFNVPTAEEERAIMDDVKEKGLRMIGADSTQKTKVPISRYREGDRLLFSPYRVGSISSLSTASQFADPLSERNLEDAGADDGTEAHRPTKRRLDDPMYLRTVGSTPERVFLERTKKKGVEGKTAGIARRGRRPRGARGRIVDDEFTRGAVSRKGKQLEQPKTRSERKRTLKVKMANNRRKKRKREKSERG